MKKMRIDRGICSVIGRNCLRAVFILLFFHSFIFLTSCSEDSEEESEFDNWQTKNDAAIVKWAANTSYRKIKTYTKNESTTAKSTNDDYIYVEVLESGSGTESPLFTDTVRVAYRGRYIPTASYPQGLVFDQSYLSEEFEWELANAVKSSAGAFIPGFTTAVMNMHVGDYWRVHIPYMLGYGISNYSSSSGSSIPGYSALVFDIAMYDFWHPGEHRPAFKSRGGE